MVETMEIKANKYKPNEILKFIRQNTNLTQKEFAKAINTTQSVISTYENGQTSIQTSFLYDICIKYHISADWILK